MSKVIVEVVESGIAPWGQLDNRDRSGGRHGYVKASYNPEEKLVAVAISIQKMDKVTSVTR
jgi:hypothetical protein